jgi:hypothetical protein
MLFNECEEQNRHIFGFNNKNNRLEGFIISLNNIGAFRGNSIHIFLNLRGRKCVLTVRT